MTGEARILHADLDAFYASVEQRDDPRLRGRPVIVGGGVVLAASYEAKAYGVRTAMGGAQARRLCPRAVVVQPRMSAYSEASKAVYRVFEDTTPLVEGLSIDEAFLDVRGLRADLGRPGRDRRATAPRRARARRPADHGRRGQDEVPRQGGQRRGQARRPARGAAGGELAFLHPLPVERLWGVGEVTARKLRALGIATVGDVAGVAEATLTSTLGRAVGRHLHALARNRDFRPVRVGRRRGSIGSQRALGRSARSREEIDAIVVGLVDRVTRRMRVAGRVGRTVVLRLRFGDFSRATRSHTLPGATAHSQTILATARWLLAAAMPMIERQGLTLVGIAVANLENETAVQLVLPLDRHSGGRAGRRSRPGP